MFFIPNPENYYKLSQNKKDSLMQNTIDYPNSRPHVSYLLQQPQMIPNDSKHKQMHNSPITKQFINKRPFQFQIQKEIHSKFMNKN